MKKITVTYILLVFAGIAGLVSCKKEDNNPGPGNTNNATEANVDIRFNNQVDGQNIQFGQMLYTNAAGNQYQVELLKYYVSHIVLVDSSGNEVAAGNFDLVDAQEPATCTVNAGKIPNGVYTKMKFNIGIPQDRNHNGAQEGDLDPMHGMIWDWNTGYVFFKHEGKFVNTLGETKFMALHFGTDRAFTTLEIPVNIEVKGIAKVIHITFNLNSLYKNSTVIDFNTDNDRQSSSASDYPWIDNMKANFPGAFTFNRAE